MKLFVKVLNGEEIKLEVFQAQTILSVKQKIEIEQDISVDQQRLLFNGKPLSDGKCLCDYSINDGNKINLIVKPSTKNSTNKTSSVPVGSNPQQFWNQLERILKKHFNDADYQKLISQFQKDYKSYIDNLSLDDIERIACALQNQKEQIV